MMEPIAMKMWFRKYIRLLAFLIVTTVAVTAYYFAPSKGERQAMELEGCKKKCAPRAGVMEGQRGLPNASPTERRNHLRFAKCACR